MYALIFLKTRKDASILTSSIASLYCLYLQWTAMSSDSKKEYNENLSSGLNNSMQIALGMFFTVFSLFVISSSTAGNGEGAGSHLMENENPIP
jgi:hypothetical protein